MPCHCGSPRPEEKLADIQDEYYDEETQEQEETEKKIMKYEAMVDAIRHGDIPMPYWYKKMKGVK